MPRGKPSRPGSPASASTGIPRTIDYSRSCDQCGYDLIGLSADGVCPECGTPITRGRRFGEHQAGLADAPAAYARMLSWGALLLMAGWIGLSGCTLIIAVASFWQAGLALMAMALLWGAGVVLVTMARPEPWDTGGVGGRGWVEAGGWVRLRMAARVLAGFWVLAGAAVCLILAGTGTPPPALRLVLAGSVVLAAAGMVVLNVYVSDLAFRASDQGLMESLRVICWMLPFSVPLFVLAGTSGSAGVRPLFFTSTGGRTLIVTPLTAVLILGPVIWQIALLVRFQRTVWWSGRDREEHAERTVRLRAAAEAAAKGMTESRDCPSCGYDLMGLPYNTVCPECGAMDESVRRAHVPPARRPAPLDLPSIPLAKERGPEGKR